MTPAITCGNRIMAATTTTAAHSKAVPSHLPRRAHSLARCRCQKPSASKAMENPNNQGRKVVKNALAAPAPKAAAKPIGRQQLKVASEAKIAPTEAEMPVPCLTRGLRRGPRGWRAVWIPREASLFPASRDTDGSREQSPLNDALHRRHHGRSRGW